MTSTLAAMSSCRSIVLATRSSGAILSEEFLDVVKLLCCQHHPALHGLQGSVEILETVAEFINYSNLFLELFDNNQLLLQGLDLFSDKFLFVFGDGKIHDLNIMLDLTPQSHNAVPCVIEDLLSLGQVLESLLEVESFLNFSDLLKSLLNLNCYNIVVLGVANPGFLGVI